MLYEVRKRANYGKLSGRNVDDMRSGAGSRSDEAKRDALDFALWKGAKPGEPAWETPVGPGPPRLAHRVLGDGDEVPRRSRSTSTAAGRT